MGYSELCEDIICIRCGSKSIEFDYSRMAYTLDMNLFLSSL